MKPETNNEIDLLLRRMARGNGVARDGEVQSDDRHLDADELSSYAQNALPAAARARYTGHLVECAACRKLVTELSLALGSVAVAAPVEVADEPSAWKKFFASLFSPMVLRYAVPALGVIAVMVVGFVVLRRQAQHDFVAKLEKPQASSPATSASTEASETLNDRAPEANNKLERHDLDGLTTGNAQSGSADNRVAGVAPSSLPTEQRSVQELRPVAAPQPPPPAATTAAAPTAEPQHETVTIAKEQPTTAKEKAEARPAKGNADNAPSDQVAQRGAQPGTAEQDKAKPEAKSESNSAFSMAGGAVARSRTAGLATLDAKKRGEASKDAENSTSNEETRTVAGRHFRKQGNAWIDTAYESSTATVNMARNSEQFRALVADEPAIGTIARQLDGEVIVVWKGRAYRIR